MIFIYVCVIIADIIYIYILCWWSSFAICISSPNAGFLIQSNQGTPVLWVSVPFHLHSVGISMYRWKLHKCFLSSMNHYQPHVMHDGFPFSRRWDTLTEVIESMNSKLKNIDWHHNQGRIIKIEKDMQVLLTLKTDLAELRLEMSLKTRDPDGNDLSFPIPLRTTENFREANRLLQNSDRMDTMVDIFSFYDF